MHAVLFPCNARLLQSPSATQKGKDGPQLECMRNGGGGGHCTFYHCLSSFFMCSPIRLSLLQTQHWRVNIYSGLLGPAAGFLSPSLSLAPFSVCLYAARPCRLVIVKLLYPRDWSYRTGLLQSCES